jgi:hypothetical protein
MKTRKHFLKKLRKTGINRKIFHVHGLEDLILLRCQYYKGVYRFNAILIETSMMFSGE